MEGKKKYTLGESAAIFGFGGFSAALIMFVFGVPVMLLMAWIRETIWNWFAVPYFHLPHIGLWLMLTVGLFWSLFTTQPAMLKDELKKYNTWKEGAFAWGGYGFAFLLAWMVHRWILKG